MTASEKFKRINNPIEPSDYGLSLSEDELRAFPEGRRILLLIRLKQRANCRSSRVMRKFGEAARKTIDSVVANIAI